MSITPDPTTPAAGVWPPTAATPDSAVWPPAPNSPPSATVLFSNVHVRAAGNISDFRTGELSIYKDGVTINGKAVYPAQTQYWILVAVFFLRLWLIAAIILEYAMRQQQTLPLSWAEIDQVVWVPKKSRVCIVYHRADKNGNMKQYSLATKLDPESYSLFTTAVNANAPASVRQVPQGKLSSSWRSPLLWSLLTGWGIIAVVYLVLTMVGFATRTH